MAPHDPTATPASAVIADVVEKYDADLVDLRRDLHRHPELSWSELRTAERAVEPGRAGRLARHPLQPAPGSRPTSATDGPLVALRADMDALPVQDLTDDPWASTVPGVAHACGHDVHTTALVGAALALAEVHDRGLLPGRVRLLFQPAEEVMPGGAVHLMDEGALDEVERIFALHCDPGVDVGQVGLRLGPLTSAADRVEVRLTGTGGHTSRPHLTGDLTFALAKVTTELPAVLSRRMDPRAGVSVVWGSLHAGSAPNVIPDHGLVTGTVRILDAVAWADCEGVVREVVDEIVRPYGVTAEIDYQRGVPPVVNEPGVQPDPGRRGARGARRGGPGRGPAEPRRRGLRLVPRPGPGRDDAARHPDAGRRDVRPAPGQPARRRARDGHRRRLLAEAAMSTLTR